MARQEVGNITLEGARIIFRNFAGEASKYNRKGDRSFGVIIDDPDLAAQLSDDGWNVKILKPRDEDDRASYYLNVKVAFGNYPPEIYMVTSRNKNALDEETIGLLDTADIKFADIIIRPYSYDVQGQQGIAAYVKRLYVVIEEDHLAEKYAHL